MPYCTQQDLEARFGAQELIQLTDRAAAGAIDTAVLGQAIADADAQIDRKLRGRYAVPINPPPAELVPIACDLARYYLYGFKPPQEVKDRFDAALAELRDYAKGINVLAVAGTNSSATQDAGISVQTPAQVFTDATLAKMP